MGLIKTRNEYFTPVKNKIYFAHKELEISYLTWFKLVTKKFLVHYSEKHEIDKEWFRVR